MKRLLMKIRLLLPLALLLAAGCATDMKSRNRLASYYPTGQVKMEAESERVGWPALIGDPETNMAVVGGLLSDRNSKTELGETARAGIMAGGALLGASIAGPVGAVVGAGAGAVATMPGDEPPTTSTAAALGPIMARTAFGGSGGPGVPNIGGGGQSPGNANVGPALGNLNAAGVKAFFDEQARKGKCKLPKKQRDKLIDMLFGGKP